MNASCDSLGSDGDMRGGRLASWPAPFWPRAPRPPAWSQSVTDSKCHRPGGMLTYNGGEVKAELYREAAFCSKKEQGRASRQLLIAEQRRGQLRQRRDPVQVRRTRIELTRSTVPP